MDLIRRDGIELTLAGARVALEAAIEHAESMGLKMVVAVADSGGWLMALYRMDGAKLTSVDIAMNKAFTAAGTRKPTHEYAAIGGAGGSAFGIHASNQGRFTVFGGGVPILVDGQCIGAVGCSGGSAEQDREVAEAGIAALVERIG
ncbi:MAG: heme-binding protein [Chthonomonadales bacterium]|nr:heme-binding protein [Chthonomonadales bacterium]